MAQKMFVKWVQIKTICLFYNIQILRHNMSYNLFHSRQYNKLFYSVLYIINYCILKYSILTI